MSLFSCGMKTPRSGDGSDSATTTPLTIDSVYCDTTFVYGNETDAPTCEIHIHLPFASGSNAAEFNDSVALYASSTRQIRPLTRDSLQAAINRGAKEFIDSFVTDMEDAADYNPDYMRGAGYYLNVNYSISNAIDSVLVCGINETTYTGGAHGSYYISYINVDRRDGHVITLDELCDEAHEKALTDSIVKQVMADNNCATLEQLKEETGIFMLSDEPVVADNFYFSEKGITFTYNQYEIAPYAVGVIEVTLPYATMKAFAPARPVGTTAKK